MKARQLVFPFFRRPRAHVTFERPKLKVVGNLRDIFAQTCAGHGTK